MLNIFTFSKGYKIKNQFISSSQGKDYPGKLFRLYYLSSTHLLSSLGRGSQTFPKMKAILTDI